MTVVAVRRHIVRDVPRGQQIGHVSAVTLRWWKGQCLMPDHEPVSANTRTAAADELRRHVRSKHWQ